VKLLALAALAALLAPAADIRFEADGLRVDGALVQGRVLELKGTGSAALLASGASVEALTSSLEIGLAPDRTLVLDPGLRVTREEGGYRFVSHQNRRIRFSGAEGAVAAAGSVLVSATASGWLIGDHAIAGTRLHAGVQGQDDSDANLDRMLKSKEKMQGAGVPKLETRVVRLYRGDPLTGANASGTVAVRQIGRVSPDGGP
jgi:hypothetical protein